MRWARTPVDGKYWYSRDERVWTLFVSCFTAGHAANFQGTEPKWKSGLIPEFLSGFQA
jgi:hypothetical protein